MGRALIIGHTGQDGRILWSQLEDDGFVLTGVSSRETRQSSGAVGGPVDLSSLTAVLGLLEACQPAQIYFLPARHHSSGEAMADAGREVLESWQLHVNAFRVVLDAAAVVCPEAGIFYASSSRIFGRSGGALFSEDSVRRPECIYGITKAAGMLVAGEYRLAKRMRVSCGILFNHESPLRRPEFVSQRIVRGVVSIKRGELRTLSFGDIEAQVDWGYAPDYTRAMRKMLDADEPSEFVVATGRTHRVSDFLRIAAERVDLDWRSIAREDGALLKRASQGLAGDATKLRRTTGWEPSIDFEAMVRLLVDAELARVSTGGS